MDRQYVLLFVYFFISIKIILQRGICAIPKSHVYGSTPLLQRTEAARDKSLVPEPNPLPWRHGIHESDSWNREIAQPVKWPMHEVLSLDPPHPHKKLGMVVLCL